MSALQLITVPFHSGRRAVGMGLGPLTLIADHGLANRLADYGYDVAVTEIEEPDLDDREIARTFEIDRRVATAARAALEQGRVPIVLSGSCNSSLGTTAAIPAERLGALWFDAHADFDIPDDNLSGFFDVMALSTLTGSCWATLRKTIPGFREIPERNVVLVGVRDLEPYQHDRLQQSAIRVAYGGERNSLSIEQAAIAHLDALAPSVDTLYLHVDFDSLDDSYGRANQYAAPFGLRLEQLTNIAAAARARIPVGAIAFTAYDPTLDDNDRFAAVAIRAIEVITTAAVAVRKTT
jgi:arginase